MFLKSLEAFKYKIIRFIESNYKINLLIYNNIHLFKFFLPHEKDFYGMLLLCENSKNKVILDIGASLGISSLGFRKLGFKNKIYAFEPNHYLYKKYLKKNLTGYRNIFIKNLALGNNNTTKFMYTPFYKTECIHYFSSFNKEYLINSIKITFPKILNKIKIKKKKIVCKKFDDLGLNVVPHFIKIDTEGHDHYILKGLTKTIKKHSPIFLIEYNKEYFNNIKKLLKDYYPYIYDLKNNKMIKLKNKINKKKISRTTKENYLSSRNIFYVPKIKKIN